MSAENVEKARTFYPTEPLDIAATLSRDDAAETLEAQFGEIFHPDFETVPDGPLEAEKGMKGFVEGFREWFSGFDSWIVTTEDVIDAGDKVLVLLEIVGRSKTDQVELPQRAANVLTFRDGRISRFELHLRQDAAWDAVGLDPETRRPAGD